MDTLYSWILLWFLHGSATADLPLDTLILVDPADPMASSLFMDAVFEDIPDGIVTDLCLVESGGCRRAIPPHQRDSKHSSVVLAKARRRGHLSPLCPFYWGPFNASTRGNHGQIYAYTTHLLGACLPTSTLDMPFFSALGAALRARAVCDAKYNSQSREIRKGLRAERTQCTSEDIRHTWAGLGKDRDAVVARWHVATAKWRQRARWRTDWRGVCRDRKKRWWEECSEALENRPDLAAFRRRAYGERLG